MFLENLKDCTEGKLLFRWQIAAQGVWEDAKIIDQNIDNQQLEELLEWLENQPQDVAIESFYCGTDEEFFFFGIRIEDLTKAQQKHFVSSLINTAPKDADFLTVLTIVKNLIGDPGLLSASPDFMELGAEGYWSSYGSYKIWNSGNRAVATLDDIKTNAPQLVMPFKRSIMLEFAWKSPLPLWIGLQVSEKVSNGEFLFSEKRYKAYTNILF